MIFYLFFAFYGLEYIELFCHNLLGEKMQVNVSQLNTEIVHGILATSICVQQ